MRLFCVSCADCVSRDDELTRTTSWSSVSTLTEDEFNLLYFVKQIDCESVDDSDAGTESFCLSDEGYEL